MRFRPIVWAAVILVLVIAVDWYSAPLQHIRDVEQQTGDHLISPQYPLERARWWAEVQGPPPSRAQIARARQVFDRQIQLRNRGDYRDAGINSWEDLGPKNVGGRIRAIAINPTNSNEIFIGSVSGGIWKSSDGGTNWVESTPAPLAYPVTSLAIDPVNPDNIYASTGEYTGTYLSWNTIPNVNLAWANPPGVGILKSNDGGLSWDVTTSPDTSFLWLNKVIINPLDPDILYTVGSTADSNQTAASDRRAVFRSNDAGDTWTQLWGGGTVPEHVMDIEINPNDTSELLIGTISNAYISNNSGIAASWTSLLGSAPLITTPGSLTGRRCELAYCQSTPSTIFVLRYLTGANNTSQLWQTTNGGANWALRSTTTGGANASVLGGQGNYDNTIWVDPSNCNQAIMGGINLWKWSNSNLTRISQWQDDIGGNNAPNGNDNSVHADHHIIVPDPNYDGSSNTRVYFGNDGGIYKSDTIWGATTNSGWLALNTELNITQFYGVDVSRTGDTLVGGTQDNSYCTFRQGDGDPQFWEVFSTGDGAHCAIKKSNPEIIYTSTQNANCYKSTDGGDSFCHMLSLSNASLLTSCPRRVFNQNPLFIAPLEMDPNDDETLYSGGQGLMQSKDEGANWSSIFTTTDRISTIEIAKGDTNNIWVGLRNGDIWQTTNGGTPWSQVDAAIMPNNIVTDLAINPNNHNEVLATFGSGFNSIAVWYTDDGGSTWTDRSPNFDTRVYCATWHPQVSNWVYIGTAFGILASEDDGVNWNITPLFSGNNDGPVFTAVTELVWQGDGSTAHPYHLVAATYGRGAWRTEFPIRSKYYVDKNCSPCGLGTFSQPYATFKEALEVAGNGTEIIFLSGGTYNEIPAEILIQRRIKISLAASSTPVIIE